MSETVKWTTPRDVRQDYNDTCWAAVLEAFCAVAPGRPKVKQGDLVKQFEKYEMGKTDGTMSRRGLRTILKDIRFGLKVQEMTPEDFGKGPGVLAGKLAAGHVVLGFWEPKIPGWHVGLVYGLDGSKASYLNPDAVWGGLLTTDLKYFCTSGKGNLIVAYRSW